MADTILTGLRGRMLGLDTAQNLLGTRGATDPTNYPVSSMHKVRTAIASATAENSGHQVLDGGTATAVTYEIKAPAPGVGVNLFINSSASECTIGGTATDTIFKPAEAGAGSSMFLSAANLAGKALNLMGISDKQYAVQGSTIALTIG